MRVFLLIFYISVALFFGIKNADAAISRAPNNLGLVGYWSFDEGTSTAARDFSGNGNHGTLTNGPVWTYGKHGKALSFNGSNTSVTTGKYLLNIHAALGGSFTAAAWIKPTAVGTRNYIFSEDLDGANKAWSLSITSTSSVSYIYASDYKNITTTNSPIVVNQWNHVAVSCTNAGVLNIYVNGSNVLNRTSSNCSSSAATPTFRIGVDRNGYFSGVIDEVRGYNRALSDVDITALYNSGAAKLNSTRTDVMRDGLVGHWTMDGKDLSGTTGVLDVSGMNNHGNMSGMTRAANAAQGRIGQALTFSGSADNVSVPDHSSLDFGAGQDFTVSTWVKSTLQPVGSQWPGIVAKDNNQSSTNRYAFGMTLHTSNTDARWSFGITVAGTGYGAFGQNDVADGKWHHLVGIRSGSNLLVYEDGVYVRTEAASSASIANTASVTFGTYSTSGTVLGDFDGEIDDTRIYNRALTAAEVKQLYNMGADTKVNVTATSSPALANSLVGHWTFDGKNMNWATGKSNDISASAYHGTLVGLSTSTSPVQGVMGQGITFDGVDDYIFYSGNAALDLSQTYFTAALWVKLPDLSTTRYVISKKGNNNRGWRLGIRSDGLVEATGYGVANTTVRTSASAISDSRWHHIALVRSDTSYYIYVDGSSQALAVTPSATPQAGSSGLMVGAEAPTTGSPTIFNQYSLDDLRIYNRALSAAEVKQLYNMGR